MFERRVGIQKKRHVQSWGRGGGRGVRKFKKRNYMFYEWRRSGNVLKW